MLREEYLQYLLSAIYDTPSLNVYDHAAGMFSIQSEDFADTKYRADQLVRDKLARYTDEEHTALQLTNFGRYWILKGGYEAFLKEGQRTKDLRKENDEHKVNLLHKEKEDLTEARLRLTHYRLVGFWLMIIISSIGFFLSVYNLYLIIKGKK